MTSEANGCGGETNMQTSTPFRTQKGEIYESLEDCQWRITTDPGKSVKFTINRMDLKNTTNSTHRNPDGSCNGDYLEIRDGAGIFSPLLHQLCGNVIPQRPIVSTTNAFWIRFFSDATYEGKGVTATLEPIECNVSNFY